MLIENRNEHASNIFFIVCGNKLITNPSMCFHRYSQIRGELIRRLAFGSGKKGGQAVFWAKNLCSGGQIGWTNQEDKYLRRLENLERTHGKVYPILVLGVIELCFVKSEKFNVGQFGKKTAYVGGQGTCTMFE